MFADVVGSTRLYEELGDASAQRMVKQCLDIANELIATHGGRTVTELGDEVMAIFHLAVELLTELLDQLSLGPGQPVVLNFDGEQALFDPAIALHVFGGAAVAAVAVGKPLHRLTSGRRAA